jgi:hypothetical protein
MTRQQLEHIIRAAGSITDERAILVLGSQAILASEGKIPEMLLHSMEADVFPLTAPDKMELINGSIGEISRFHETFGYYAHGILPESCPLPSGWDKRLNPIRNENTNGITGLCLNADDLACSKLAAGRPKDLDFVTEMLVEKIVTIQRIGRLIADLPREEHRVSAQRSLQLVEFRVRSKEMSDSKEADRPDTVHGKEMSREDDLSL